MDKPVCGFCGNEFERRSPKGPVPRFCSPSHRQRAFERKTFMGIFPASWSGELEMAASKRHMSAVDYVRKAVRRVLDGEKKD
jgi:hypothetical protein